MPFDAVQRACAILLGVLFILANVALGASLTPPPLLTAADCICHWFPTAWWLAWKFILRKIPFVKELIWAVLGLEQRER